MERVKRKAGLGAQRSCVKGAVKQGPVKQGQVKQGQVKQGAVVGPKQSAKGAAKASPIGAKTLSGLARMRASVRGIRRRSQTSQ